MIINPNDVALRDRYKLTIGAVVPRPIAWVSTIDASGNLNVAPFSFFTAVCSNPMTLLFCVGYSAAPDKAGKKDTLRNIEQVPEFVINMPNEETAEAMNLTAATLPHGQSEFEIAGITPAPSQSIRVPRIAEAPIAYECKLQQIVTISNQPGGGYTIFGEVQQIYIRDDVYDNGYVELDAYKPIGRLSGMSYTRVTDVFEMQRP
jgi:flavin reductase (DIM6/NTAB) family NADH-FMN oxidoreductase RutF